MLLARMVYGLYTQLKEAPIERHLDEELVICSQIWSRAQTHTNRYGDLAGVALRN